MSKKKAKQLANHIWNVTEEEIEVAIKKAINEGRITEEETRIVKERIEERKKYAMEEKRKEIERKKAREAESILQSQEEDRRTEVAKTEQRSKKVWRKITPPTRKNLRGAAAAEKLKAPNRKTGEEPGQIKKEERMGRILSLPKATQGDPLKRIIKNKRHHPVTIWEFPLFPEDIGIEINTMGAIFTEKKDCFVANFCGVLIKDIPKELRYEDNLKGVFSLTVVKKVEEKWEDLYLNLIYRRELNGSKSVYVERIDSEKEDPIPGSIHTTPTTNARMILHLYPM